MFLLDCYRINKLREQEKEALHRLLGQSQQEALAQLVGSQNLINLDDVPVSHLLAIYRLRLKSLDPQSANRHELEHLVGNMTAFQGDLIRLNIVRSSDFQRVVFTDKSYNKLMGCLSSTA